MKGTKGVVWKTIGQPAQQWLALQLVHVLRMEFIWWLKTTRSLYCVVETLHVIQDGVDVNDALGNLGVALTATCR